MSAFKKILPFLFILAALFISSYGVVVRDFPEKHEIKDFDCLVQPDGITCGPTSTLMVLRRYGYDMELDDVKRHTRTHWFSYDGEPVGMTVPDYVVIGMRRIGLKVNLRRGDLRLLKHYVGQNRPCIVLLRSSYTTWHYVVVVGYTQHMILFADPGCGRVISVTTQQFIDAWNFTKDMDGCHVTAECRLCTGTGKWLKFPPIDCEFCGGTGRKPDLMCGIVKAADVRPYTMIVPETSLPD